MDRLFLVTLTEGITLSAGEEVDEVAGGAGGMGVDGIGKVGLTLKFLERSHEDKTVWTE